MATLPSEQHGNSNPAEPPADVHLQTEKKYDVHVTVGSAPSQSRGTPEISKKEVHNPPSLQVAFRGDWESAKRFFGQDSASNIALTLYFQTEKKDEVKDETIGSAPSQSRDALEISEIVVGEEYYRPLLQAAFRGDWESAKRFFEQDPASMVAKITRRSETVLHIAALSAQDQFVENLVELLSPYPQALAMVDCDRRTALHNAVQCGRIKMVKALVRRNTDLTLLADKKGHVPLIISTFKGSAHKEIAWFLAKNMTELERPSLPFIRDSAIDLIIELTFAGQHDIALYLVGRHPHLLTKKRRNLSVLGVLARMQSHFLSVTRLSVLEALIFKCIPVDLNYKPRDENSRNMQTSMDPVLQYLASLLWNATNILVPPIKRIHEVKLKHGAAVELAKQVCHAISDMKPTEITEFFLERNLLGFATTKGNSELVKIFIQFFPQLIRISPNGESLMTHAVKSRQERILSLFLKVSSTNELSLVPAPTPEEADKMMLAAAKYDSDFDAATYVSGATFQMQRELQWFNSGDTWPAFHTTIYGHTASHPSGAQDFTSKISPTNLEFKTPKKRINFLDI